MIIKAPDPINDDFRMPFGKYKGERIGDTPVKYLHFLWSQPGFDRKSPVGLYIQNNLSALETENTDLIWT